MARKRKNLWPFSLDKRVSPRQTTAARGGIASRLPARKGAGASGQYRGYKLYRTVQGEFYSSLDPDSLFDTKRQAEALIDSYLKGRANPQRTKYGFYDIKHWEGNLYVIASVDGTEIGPPMTRAKALKKAARLDLQAYERQRQDFIRWRNPQGTKREFQRCVEAVEAKGGAYDPRAVCASMERRKYGQAELTRRAVAGKRAKRKRRNVAPLSLGAPSVFDLLQREHAAVQKVLSRKRNPADAVAGMEVANVGPSYGYIRRLRAQISREIKKRDRYPSWADPYGEGEAQRRYVERLEHELQEAEASYRAWHKHNPPDAASEMSERFHGRPVTEVVELNEDVFYHSNLAELGELERLKVKALDGGIVTLTGFEGALLCSNEEGTQLYVRGGDQAVDPAQFAVQKPYHDTEDLGEVVKIWYFTTKKHLGREGGTASYHHSFGEEDSGKKRRPRLVYSVRDQLLSFVGGAYKIEPEGIRN